MLQKLKNYFGTNFVIILKYSFRDKLVNKKKNQVRHFESRVAHWA